MRSIGGVFSLMALGVASMQVRAESLPISQWQGAEGGYELVRGDKDCPRQINLLVEMEGGTPHVVKLSDATGESAWGAYLFVDKATDKTLFYRSDSPSDILAGINTIDRFWVSVKESSSDESHFRLEYRNIRHAVIIGVPTLPDVNQRCSYRK